MSTEVALDIVRDVMQNSSNLTSPPKLLPPMVTKEDEDPEAAVNASPKVKTRNSSKCCTSWKAMFCIFKVVFFIGLSFYVFVYLLYSVIAWLFCGIDVTKQQRNRPNSQSANDAQFYQKVSEMQKAAHKIGKDIKFARSRLVTFVLIWVILNLSIPTLRNLTLLGSSLWKWTLLLAMILCGYHVTSLITSSALRLLATYPSFKSYNSAVYFAQGLRISANLVAYSWAVLATWVFYFRTSKGLNTSSPDKAQAFHVLTWTFAMLAVAAVLWLVKNAMLLVWEANAVYNRFGQRILSAGFQLYFVGHICRWNNNKENLKIFRPRRELHQDQNNLIEEEAAAAEATKSNWHIQRAKFYQGVSIYHIMKMTEYLIDLSKVSSREDDGTSDVLDMCRLINPNNAFEEIRTENLVEKYGLEKEDATILCLDLNRDNPLEDSDKFLYDNFEKAMVRGHKNCVALGHTLSDAIEVVQVLNKVSSFVLMALVAIAWLLITDITTNNILVLIASPFLAATFVFGDTCKKTFEGLIFSFISHPFDVGDLCVIDGLELEVKRMGILKTTFILIATKEEVLYPNSVLATKTIVNLKGEPDPSDCVELKLDSSMQTRLVSLKDNITKFFKNDGGKRFEEAISITVEEIGSCIRLTIRYKHVISINDITHSQCHGKKRKQRSEFLMAMAQYMNDTN